MPFILKLTPYKCLPALLYVVLSHVLLPCVLKHVCPVGVEGFNLPPKVLPDNWTVLNSAALFLCPVLSENLSWMFATLDTFIVVSPIGHSSIKHLSPHQASSVRDPTVSSSADFIWLENGPVHSEGTSIPANLDPNHCFS